MAEPPKSEPAKARATLWVRAKASGTSVDIHSARHLLREKDTTFEVFADSFVPGWMEKGPTVNEPPPMPRPPPPTTLPAHLQPRNIG